MDTPANTRLIDEHANGLVALGRVHPLVTPVPTCGDWTLADLLWHLTEVHHFWCHVIAGRPDAGPETYDRPTRPPDDAALADGLEAVAHELVDLLDRATPSDAAWSWSDDHTVGFTIRRQTHEAIVHHLDGVLAAGGSPSDVSIDGAVAADGVDELVSVMLGGIPDWAEFVSDGTTIRLVAVDRERHWDLGFGRMVGRPPGSDRTYDLIALDPVRRLDAPTTTIAASGIDLLLWMWGRVAIDRVRVDGDATGADRLRQAVLDGTQ